MVGGQSLNVLSCARGQGQFTQAQERAPHLAAGPRVAPTKSRTSGIAVATKCVSRTTSPPSGGTHTITMRPMMARAGPGRSSPVHCWKWNRIRAICGTEERANGGVRTWRATGGSQRRTGSAEGPADAPQQPRSLSPSARQPGPTSPESAGVEEVRRASHDDDRASADARCIRSAPAASSGIPGPPSVETARLPRVSQPQARRSTRPAAGRADGERLEEVKTNEARRASHRELIRCPHLPALGSVRFPGRHSTAAQSATGRRTRGTRTLWRFTIAQWLGVPPKESSAFGFCGGIGGMLEQSRFAGRSPREKSQSGDAQWRDGERVRTAPRARRTRAALALPYHPAQASDVAPACRGRDGECVKRRSARQHGAVHKQLR